MDLGEWLRSLGLEQYEAVFRENAVAGAPRCHREAGHANYRKSNSDAV
jgi:hypothetical protein